MLIPRFLARVPSNGGVGLGPNFPASIPFCELYLDSRTVNGQPSSLVADGGNIGVVGVTPWTDLSGQTFGPARDAESAANNFPVIRHSGSKLSPAGTSVIDFTSQTSMPINANPYRSMTNGNPTGVGNPWDVVTRGHTFIFVGRFYNMGTASANWSDTQTNRAQWIPRGDPQPNPFVRSQAGISHNLNTPGSIFTANPLPWGLFVMRFRPPVNTNGGIDLRRWELASGWIDYSPAATAQWSTLGATGYFLSGQGPTGGVGNIPQNMDLGAVLWYSTALSDDTLDLLRVWNEIYFGSE